jgi:hypothetical protein
MRDDFPEKVKRILADRVNSHCSNPLCARSTKGPTAKVDGVANVGVAAHITAASAGGKRYDSSLTPAERKAPENGIWCCEFCAKLIDNDEVRYTVSLLRSWKASAERQAQENLESPFKPPKPPRIEIARLGGAITKSAVFPDVKELCTMMPEEFKAASEIKLLDHGHGAFGQHYAVLAAGINHGWDFGVGLFTAGEFGWELVANIRLENQRAWVPEAFYVPGQPGALAVTHVHAWGTGVFRRSTTWYRIARGEPLPLLSYPYRFYIYGFGMRFGRELSAHHQQIPKGLTQGELLSIDFEVAYSTPNEPQFEHLFTLSDTLNLEWNETANAFVPHTSADDPARIEDMWMDDQKRFVAKHYGRLKEIAKTCSPTQREVIQVELLGKNA